MTTPHPHGPSESQGLQASPGRLYTDLAPWWYLLSAPEEYGEAAAFYSDVIRSSCVSPPQTLLELGSGGGNNASFLKRLYRLTLVDISPEMLAQSQTLNPECAHVTGDMRSVRLQRQFDAVLVQDAVSYMLSEADLEQAMQTAFVHCRPGGVALFAPDYVRENFRSATSHGGHDGHRRAMRYLEWTWDPDPADSTYLVDFAYLLRDENGEPRVESDRLQLGLFHRAEWLRLLGKVGFATKAIPFTSIEDGPGAELFVGVKPARTQTAAEANQPVRADGVARLHKPSR